MRTEDVVRTYLEARGFKRHGNTYRGNSPFRSDSDSDAFIVTFDDAGGTYYDHVTKDTGTLRQLAESLGLIVPVTDVQNTKRPYTGLADYAKAHGVEAAVFEAAGWTETTTDGRPALAFKTANGTRYRFLDGNKPPYKSPAGYESCWYGLGRAAKMAAETGAPLVLVNGEASVVVCQHYGIPAAAVTSGGERAYSEPLLSDLRAAYAGKVAIVFDCDDAGRAGSQALAAQLTGYSVAVIDLGLDKHGDAADWCALYGEQALPKLLERATFKEPPAPRKTRISIAELVTQVQERATAIQSGKARMYLPTGYAVWDKQLDGGMPSGVSVIGGSSGMGKTTLMASLASMWTQAGYRGLIVTTEMRPIDWIPRIVAHMARVSSRDIVTGNIAPALSGVVAESYARLADAGHEVILETAPLVSTVSAHVLQLIADNALDFVLIDSISNMRSGAVSASIYDQTKAVSNGLVELANEAQLLVGPNRPIPIVVSVQTNTLSVLRRSVKIANQLDAYGGQTVGQDAATYTTLNYHHYFVQKQLAEPDPALPQGVAALVVDKSRFGGGSNGDMIRMRFVGGMGFYDDHVPAAVNTAKSNGHSAPRQYKDDTFGEVVERETDIPF